LGSAGGAFPEGLSWVLDRNLALSVGQVWKTFFRRSPKPAPHPDFVVILPLYIPLVVLALPTSILFHRDRRSARWARAGHCPNCGYDRAGLTPAAACPECGSASA
jgi:hypothetical protein